MSHKNNDIILIDVEEHQQFQALLAELSSSFLNVPPDQLEQAIKESFYRIAKNLDIDQISLGLITSDGLDFYFKHSYAKPGTIRWEAGSLMSEGPYLTKVLLNGQPFIMHDVEDLPPEAATDKAAFQRYGVKADLVFPFIVGGNLTGAISFSVTRPRQWTDEVVQGLSLIADVFANVLERKFAVQALQYREVQMRLAAEAADIGLWVWNCPQDSIWATEIARKLYAIEVDEKLNLQRFLQYLHPDDKQRVSKTMQQVLQGGGDLQVKYRIVHPDGSEHWISVSGRCYRDSNGQPERLMGASMNISDIRRTKLELEQANQDLSIALEEIRTLKDQLQQENIYLRHEISGRQEPVGLVSGSAAMETVLMQIEQVAPTLASVLIIGETGTGKELLATAIHEASPRKDRAMICVNCAAIPSALIESELFGREKGAYTGALSKQIGRFELAHGSTLFLDEIGELPLESQVKLLRALQALPLS
jgi:formate hydrogenlyase transcriptional activator